MTLIKTTELIISCQIYKFVTQIDSLVDVPEELCDLNPQVKLNWFG